MSEKPVTRKIDFTTGHGPFAPKLPVGWSPDVYTNDENTMRETDPYAIHCVGPSCHPSVLQQGSTGQVFVNDLPIGRLTDPLDCGCFVAQSSTDVFSS